MEVFCYVMLLLAAVCLQQADSGVSTAKEGEKPPVDCSSYILSPKDVEKMSKCISQATIEQIINNITNATAKKIEGLQSELPKMKSLFTTELQELRKKVHQLEKNLNSSHWQCKLSECSFRSLDILPTRSTRLPGLEKQRLPYFWHLSSVSGKWAAFGSLL